ncbi:MAG: hypothetical protein ACYCU3_01450 [Streptosporangiaceae bacterium]
MLLGALVATSAGFGSNGLVLEISGSSAGLVLLIAGSVWLDRRLRPARSYLRQPTRIGGAVMLAVAAALGFLGIAFGAWLMIIAVVPLIAAIGLEVLARRQRTVLPAFPARETIQAEPRHPVGPDGTGPRPASVAYDRDREPARSDSR